MKVYEVEGERPLLKVALMKAKGENGEDELLGQAAVAIDGKWKDNEYDRESPATSDWAEPALRPLQLTAILLSDRMARSQAQRPIYWTTLSRDGEWRGRQGIAAEL